ncbi:SPX domain-containing protein [Lyophyllum atratum]|nr:SPX domain-containing protein [Lyophyllum atratum]
MKFSSSLKFNAVSEWWEDYISYDALKKSIYQLEKQQHGDTLPFRDIEANEAEALLSSADRSNTDPLFEPLLNKELHKVVSFYEIQEKELQEEVAELEELVARQEEEGLAAGERYLDDPEDDDDDDDDDESVSRSPDATRRRRKLSSSSRRNMMTGSIYEPTDTSRPPLPHRLSISSSSSSIQDPDGGNRSPTTMSKLASKFGTLKDSITSAAVPDTIWTSRSDYAYDTRLLYKRKITTLYVALSNLKSYVEINQSGFRKILKKYDKVTYSELKDRYMHEVVERAFPFRPETKDRLNEAIQRLVDLYTKCVTRGDKRLAVQQLRLHKRENIAWERDTVWRQMIAQQRRGDIEGEPTAMGALLKQPGPGLFFIPTPLGTIRVTKKMIYKIIAGILFVTLLNIRVVPGREANRTFAILIFCTFLWATEAIPLFVTSMFVPLLLVVLRVIRNDKGEPMDRHAATSWVFSVMFSPTIMLLIGGFTISSALSKTNIDRVLITKVLSLAGTRPSTVLLAFMGVSCFASMWISNVAAPTLCFTLIRPILRNLPPRSAFGPCLILAIALAANIGGQSSPISSPQNLIALQAMDPPLDWGRWFIVALPVSAISILLIWVMLLYSYQPARSPDGEGDIEIKPIRATREPFTHKQWWVSFVCLVTIALWCVAHEIEPYVGDMGIIAIIPIIAFFSTGVLKKDDFEQFMWTIVFLAMGGIALGKGVMASGLLEVVDTILRDAVEGFSLYTVVLILSPVVLIISTFISHTIASVLLVPIAKEVGSNMGGNHQNLLIFITGLICSAGMGMPVSGFPNQTAATVENELGELYLSNVDFLKNGVPASIVATAVVSTVGYLLMLAIGI